LLGGSFSGRWALGVVKRVLACCWGVRAVDTPVGSHTTPTHCHSPHAHAKITRFGQASTTSHELALTRSHLRACSSSRHVWHKLHANTPHSTHLNPTGNEKTTRHSRPPPLHSRLSATALLSHLAACRAPVVLERVQVWCCRLRAAVWRCGAAKCAGACVCVCVGVGVLRRGSLVRVRVCVCVG
jgi:hypothetical protein